MTNSGKKSISDYISEGMKSALSEIEELRLQLSLGKMEAKDYFEHLKRSAREEISQAREQLQSIKQEPEVIEIINAYEHLQIQLALGLAETEQVYEEQKKKILMALHKLDTLLENDSLLNEEYGRAKLAVEKIKIKLELIGLKYRLKKVSAEFNFEEKKAEFLDKVDTFKHQLKKKEEQAEARWEHFRDEIGTAFEHIKKAFQ